MHRSSCTTVVIIFLQTTWRALAQFCAKGAPPSGYTPRSQQMKQGKSYAPLNAGFPAPHIRPRARVSDGPGPLEGWSSSSLVTDGRNQAQAAPRSRQHRGWPRWRRRSKHRRATKPPTSRLAAVEAAEQAIELRVWGVGWGSSVPEKKRLP
jgi:hypothetical protein